MGEGDHGAGKVERIYRQWSRRGLKIALEDPRQGAGLFFLQSIVPFREGRTPPRVQLALGHQERAIPLSVHGLQPARHRGSELLRLEADEALEIRHAPFHVGAQQLEADPLLPSDIPLDLYLLITS